MYISAGYLHAYKILNSKTCSQKSVSFGQLRASENPKASVQVLCMLLFVRNVQSEQVESSILVFTSFQALCFHPFVTKFCQSNLALQRTGLGSSEKSRTVKKISKGQSV